MESMSVLSTFFVTTVLSRIFATTWYLLSVFVSRSLMRLAQVESWNHWCTELCRICERLMFFQLESLQPKCGHLSRWIFDSSGFEMKYPSLYQGCKDFVSFSGELKSERQTLELPPVGTRPSVKMEVPDSSTRKRSIRDPSGSRCLRKLSILLPIS